MVIFVKLDQNDLKTSWPLTFATITSIISSDNFLYYIIVLFFRCFRMWILNLWGSPQTFFWKQNKIRNSWLFSAKTINRRRWSCSRSYCYVKKIKLFEINTFWQVQRHIWPIWDTTLLADHTPKENGNLKKLYSYHWKETTALNYWIQEHRKKPRNPSWVTAYN